MISIRTDKLRNIPRTTEHSQNIYWHSQILTVYWNTQMISIILTPCISNFQTPTQIITQYSGHNALYFHSSLIFKSKQVLLEKFLSPQLITAESDPPCICVQNLRPLQSTNHAFQVFAVCHVISFKNHICIIQFFCGKTHHLPHKWSASIGATE